MGSITLIQGTRTALTVTGLSTLASANYVASDAYDASANDPADVLLEIALATTNTPSGNKQAVVFLQASLDGSNFETGPTSGSATTDEADLSFVGIVPMNSASTTHLKLFSVMEALGFIPKQFKVVIKNDLGVAITSGTAYTAEVAVVTA